MLYCRVERSGMETSAYERGELNTLNSGDCHAQDLDQKTNHQTHTKEAQNKQAGLISNLGTSLCSWATSTASLRSPSSLAASGCRRKARLQSKEESIKS